jgi:hypothetical protein
VVKQLSRNEIETPHLKTFVKTWHEINKNFLQTAYIPNFDLYSIGQKVEVLSIFGKTSDDPDEIQFLFKEIIYAEITDLERDMAEFS